MYVSNELKGKEMDDFINYVVEVHKRIKVSLPESFSTLAVHNGDVVSIHGDIYHVEEMFDSIKSFENSGRRPLDDDYETPRQIIYEDGRVLVKGLVYMPLAETEKKSYLVERKKLDPKLFAAYMFYPRIRRYAPKIPLESFSPELYEYETFSLIAHPLSSYEGLNQLRKIQQRAYMRDQFQKQSGIK